MRDDHDRFLAQEPNLSAPFRQLIATYRDYLGHVQRSADTLSPLPPSPELGVGVQPTMPAPSRASRKAPAEAGHTPRLRFPENSSDDDEQDSTDTNASNGTNGQVQQSDAFGPADNAGEDHSLDPPEEQQPTAAHDATPEAQHHHRVHFREEPDEVNDLRDLSLRSEDDDSDLEYHEAPLGPPLRRTRAGSGAHENRRTDQTPRASRQSSPPAARRPRPLYYGNSSMYGLFAHSDELLSEARPVTVHNTHAGYEQHQRHRSNDRPASSAWNYHVREEERYERVRRSPLYPASFPAVKTAPDYRAADNAAGTTGEGYRSRRESRFRSPSPTRATEAKHRDPWCHDFVRDAAPAGRGRSSGPTYASADRTFVERKPKQPAVDYGADFNSENACKFYQQGMPLRTTSAKPPGAKPPPLVLKELPIQKFGGDYRACPMFRNRFLKAVGAREDLEPSEKFQYLLQYLDGEPLRFANGYLITDTNYFAVLPYPSPGLRPGEGVPAGEEPSLGDDVGSEENDEGLALDEPMPEKTAVDSDADLGEDVDMLDYNEAEASSDTSSNLFASAPPTDEAEPINVESSDGPAQQDLTDNKNVDQNVYEDNTAMDASFDVIPQNDSHAARYRFRSNLSDDDADDTGAQSDGEQEFIQLNMAPTEDEALTAICVLFQSALYIKAPARPEAAATPGAAAAPEAPATPAEVLQDIFAWLPRLSVNSASLTSKRFSVAVERVQCLLHIESFRLEQASPKSARLAVQSVTDAERPEGLRHFCSNMQSALAELCSKRWLHKCFVQKLDFLHPAEDARYAIADQQWRLFGDSLKTTRIAEWNIQGVHLSAVGRFADIGAPFRLAASLGTVRVRHCPHLRPNDYASISKACGRGNVRSLQLQPPAAQSSPYELMVEQMVDALSGSALTRVVLISAKMSIRFLEGLLKMSGQRRRLPSITINNSNTARTYFNFLSKRFREHMQAETGEFRIPLTALGCGGMEQYVTFSTDAMPVKTITFSPAYEARY